MMCDQPTLDSEVFQLDNFRILLVQHCHVENDSYESDEIINMIDQQAFVNSLSMNKAEVRLTDSNVIFGGQYFNTKTETRALDSIKVIGSSAADPTTAGVWFHDYVFYFTISRQRFELLKARLRLVDDVKIILAKDYHLQSATC